MLVLFATGCTDLSRLPAGADVGRQPTLAEPTRTLLPTVNVAPASPWPDGEVPWPADGMRVNAYATGLDHPRWLHVLPNGDVLVAEANAPERPARGGNLSGWIMKRFMTRAGAGVPSANHITLPRDADGDGRAELRTIFLKALNYPFGMALVAASASASPMPTRCWNSPTAPDRPASKAPTAA